MLCCQSLQSCDAATCANRQTHASHLSQLTSLLATSPAAAGHPPHPCSHDNGGCEYLCVASASASGARGGGTSRCSCPVGLVLGADESTCSTPTTCASDHFTCGGAAYCIPLAWRCDGYADCPDEADEAGCGACVGGKCEAGQRACGADETPCLPAECPGDAACSAVCVPAAQRCDGQRHCAAGEDELDCGAGRRIEMAPPAPGGRAPYTIVFVLGLFLMLAGVIGVVLLCRRKGEAAGGVPMGGGAAALMLVKVAPDAAPAAPAAPGGDAASRTTSLNSAPRSSRPLLYDRNHVTGASSSCSTLAGPYPHETLNPPPSPVSTRHSRCYPGGGCDTESAASTSLLLARRPHPPAPQPTPASTAWGDSDADKTYYDSDDADTYPPPPPCPSGVPSCPASPSTGRSFCNPYPPPPSPVGMSDC